MIGKISIYSYFFWIFSCMISVYAGLYYPLWKAAGKYHLRSSNSRV